jgi:hypothetical protein
VDIDMIVRYLRESGIHSLRQWHSLNLTGTFDSLNPSDSFWGKQLSARLAEVNDIHIIDNTRLDNSHSVHAAEGIAVSEQRGATVRTETAGNLFPAVGGLGDRPRCAFGHLEVLAWHEDVVAVQTAGDMATISTVA